MPPSCRHAVRLKHAMIKASQESGIVYSTFLPFLYHFPEATCIAIKSSFKLVLLARPIPQSAYRFEILKSISGLRNRSRQRDYFYDSYTSMAIAFMISAVPVCTCASNSVYVAKN